MRRGLARSRSPCNEPGRDRSQGLGGHELGALPDGKRLARHAARELEGRQPAPLLRRGERHADADPLGRIGRIGLRRPAHPGMPRAASPPPRRPCARAAPRRRPRRSPATHGRRHGVPPTTRSQTRAPRPVAAGAPPAPPTPATTRGAPGRSRPAARGRSRPGSGRRASRRHGASRAAAPAGPARDAAQPARRRGTACARRHRGRAGRPAPPGRAARTDAPCAPGREAAAPPAHGRIARKQPRESERTCANPSGPTG